MVYLAILTAIVVSLALVMLSLFIAKMAPSAKRMKADLAQLRTELDRLEANLVPINRQEMELFSLGQEKHVLKRGVSGITARGVYTTIFHEPVAAYVFKRYGGNKNHSILYARTAEHEYTYLTRQDKTTLLVDGQEVGVLDTNGILYGQRTGKELARVEQKGLELMPISVGGREVGNLTRKPATAGKGLNERAFELLKPDLNDKEEQLFLALALQEMVGRVVTR